MVGPKPNKGEVWKKFFRPPDLVLIPCKITCEHNTQFTSMGECTCRLQGTFSRTTGTKWAGCCYEEYSGFAYVHVSECVGVK